jgi:plasmid stability protein
MSQSHSYCVNVKNITVTIEDELYRAARVQAAKQDTSVSALVRGYLKALAHGRAPLPTGVAEDEDRKNRKRLVKLLAQCKVDLGYKPSRNKTYEGGRFSRF